MMNTVQGTILSTREGKIARQNTGETTLITRRGSRTETIAPIAEQRQGPEYHTNNPRKEDPNTAQVNRMMKARREAETKKTVDHRKGNGVSPGWDNSRRSNPIVRKSLYASSFRRSTASCRHPALDPIAQSFTVDTPGGIFVSSIDLFFKTKSTTLPATVELRTMINGYPTTEVIPFGQVNVAAADINVSDDATTATTFTFPSPVYLQPQQEYAFVALANTDEYTMYTARLGQKTLDDNRLISKQPYLGSMFKSQNGGTWDAEQNGRC